jgi:hypothetical protein
MASGAWYCRVCGAPAPDYTPARGRRRGGSNVVALPCGHEQPTGPDGYRGLEYRPDGDGPGG